MVDELKEELENEEQNEQLEDNVEEKKEETKTEKKWSSIFKSVSKNSNDEESIIEKLQKENKILKDNLLITSADLENTRKRQKDELEKTAKFATSKFVNDLLPVMDAFYLAINSEDQDKLKEDAKYKNLCEGINLTFNELKKVFERNNIVRINPIGEKFDHNFHQAISQVESDEEEGTIVFVMQAGYTLNGRLIKPALVGVSKGK